jgi:hypothetical protein
MKAATILFIAVPSIRTLIESGDKNADDVPDVVHCRAGAPPGDPAAQKDRVRAD